MKFIRIARIAARSHVTAVYGLAANTGRTRCKIVAMHGDTDATEAKPATRAPVPKSEFPKTRMKYRSTLTKRTIQ